MNTHPLLRRMAKPLLAAWAAVMLTLIATQPARSETDLQSVLDGMVMIDWSMSNCQFKNLTRYQEDILIAIVDQVSTQFTSSERLRARAKFVLAIDDAFSGNTEMACIVVESVILSQLQTLN